jgi:hypothetical protein
MVCTKKNEDLTTANTEGMRLGYTAHVLKKLNRTRSVSFYKGGGGIYK